MVLGVFGGEACVRQCTHVQSSMGTFLGRMEGTTWLLERLNGGASGHLPPSPNCPLPQVRRAPRCRPPRLR